MNLSRYGHALTQRPDFHWLDLPEATDEEMEEETVPRRKPLCSFTDKQTIFIAVGVGNGLLEFPVSGDDYSLSSRFHYGLSDYPVIGYILQRRSEFEHQFYGWGKER